MENEEQPFSTIRAPGIQKKPIKNHSSKKVEFIKRRLSTIISQLEKNQFCLQKISLDTVPEAGLISALTKAHEIHQFRHSHLQTLISCHDESTNLNLTLKNMMDHSSGLSETLASRIDKLKILAKIKRSTHNEALRVKATYNELLREEDELKCRMYGVKAKVVEMYIEHNALMKFEREKQMEEVEKKFEGLKKKEVGLVEETKEAVGNLTWVVVLMLIVFLGMIFSYNHKKFI